MTVIATASNPRFTVSRIDIDRGGATYTFDTLNELRQLRPDADLFFITGADAISQMMTWHNAHKLWDLASFVGVTRPDHELDPPVGEGRQITTLEIPAMAISSTDIRRRAPGAPRRSRGSACAAGNQPRGRGRASSGAGPAVSPSSLAVGTEPARAARESTPRPYARPLPDIPRLPHLAVPHLSNTRPGSSGPAQGEAS